MLYIERPLGRKSGHPPKVFAWYDSNPQLVEAFTVLATLRCEPKAALDHDRTLFPGLACLVIGLAISQELALYSLLLCLLGGLLLCLPWLKYRWLLHGRRMNAGALIADIKRGKYGKKVLWNDDALWEILAEALNAHGIDIVDVFGDRALTERITPLLVRLLKATSGVRHQLRTRTHDDTAMLYLRAVAEPAAAEMAILYQTTA